MNSDLMRDIHDNEYDNIDFGKKLKRYMHMAKMQPAQLAKKIKLPKERIYVLLNNEEEPTLKELILICYALFIYPENLLDYKLLGKYYEEIRKQLRANNDLLL